MPRRIKVGCRRNLKDFAFFARKILDTLLNKGLYGREEGRKRTVNHSLSELDGDLRRDLVSGLRWFDAREIGNVCGGVVMVLKEGERRQSHGRFLRPLKCPRLIPV